MTFWWTLKVVDYGFLVDWKGSGLQLSGSGLQLSAVDYSFPATAFRQRTTAFRQRTTAFRSGLQLSGNSFPAADYSFPAADYSFPQWTTAFRSGLQLSGNRLWLSGSELQLSGSRLWLSGSGLWLSAVDYGFPQWTTVFRQWTTDYSFLFSAFTIFMTKSTMRDDRKLVERAANGEYNVVMEQSIPGADSIPARVRLGGKWLKSCQYEWDRARSGCLALARIL
ncbi:hypothetical protein BDZ91DRAFT_797290 [Kalaharituber pfeilii]|nr:hypothetical protein BDZ91DRAFT_797290 [Kalaharituber pfeilii]